MTKKSPQERVQELQRQLHYHNYRYYILNDPVISDREWDRLYRELLELEQSHPELKTADSPTQRAGAPPAEGFQKVEHPAPILSLDNAFSIEELRAWQQRISRLDPRVERTDFTVEPKLDGLTVVLHYREGLFVLGATRGNSEIGENITENLRTVKSLPLRIPAGLDQPADPPENLVVRGEAFIKLSDFERLNQRLLEQGEKTYVNPRNTAAGSLRQLDSALTAERPLSLLVYQVVASSEPMPDTQRETLTYLKSLGFPVPEFDYCPDLSAVLAALEKWERRRDNLNYEIDGVVVKINDHQLSQALGVVGKAPRGAIAYKFPAQVVTTPLEDIGVNVGRTGVLTPYAVLKPVEIGGVTVRQATLHNFDFIAEKDIRIGDRVRVKRAGEVIPYVIGPVLDARTGGEIVYQPPEICPVCGEPVEHLEEEVAWYCVNSTCSAQIIRVIEHFVSRTAMDIVGLGIKIVQQLVEEGLIQDVADLYQLSKQDLVDLEGFGDKKAENILTAIQDSRDRPLARLITALGIRGVGEMVAADLAEQFEDLGALAESSLDELQQIPGIGPNTAAAVVDWFERPSNQQVLEKLRNSGVWPQDDTASAEQRESSALEGLTIVVTGKLEGFTRREIKEYLQQQGARVTGSVSGSTDYLLAGENAGSKLHKAQELGVKIIDEDQLGELLG